MGVHRSQFSGGRQTGTVILPRYPPQGYCLTDRTSYAPSGVVVTQFSHPKQRPLTSKFQYLSTWKRSDVVADMHDHNSRVYRD